MKRRGLRLSSSLNSCGSHCGSASAMAFGGTGKERGRQLRRPYVFSDTQVLLPHLHSNMWNMRPFGGSSVLLMKPVFSPHFMQGGELGFWSCFSMPDAQDAENAVRTIQLLNRRRGLYCSCSSFRFSSWISALSRSAVSESIAWRACRCDCSSCLSVSWRLCSAIWRCLPVI